MPTFTALSSAWLLLLTIPLVVFYFLKLRRPRHVIPSLVLWRQVLADQRVNSPFQRFKRNILLLLQLLLLLLLALAAMQPVLRRATSSATRLPVLIDTSASMAALDQQGGKSRLDAAKARLTELIDTLPADQQVSLIAFAKTARRLTAFTNSKTELREALATLEVEDVPGDLDEALRLAQALGRSESFDRVWLISDGNFPARTQFELSFNVDFQRVAPGGSNFGLTACNARRDLGGAWEVFVQLAGSAEAESTTGTVELWQNGQLSGSERVTLARGSAPRLSFRLATSEAADVEVRYVPEGFDSLASDNAARLHLPAPRPLSAFVPETLASARHALAAIEGVVLYPGPDGATQSGYDLVVTDREADLALPARVVASFGLVPEELRALVTIEKSNAQAIDWRRDTPALQHVSLEDVLLADDPRFAAEITDTRLRELGYVALADAPRGPLIVEKSDADQQRVHLLFHPDRSTFVYRVGYPVFISNLVQLALRRGQLSEVAATQTGPLAPRVGAAALLSAAETSLAAVDSIEFAEQIKVSATNAAPRVDRSLWWPLACAALVLLAIEWWWFNRRAAHA
ncbi:MAG: VWA domain-containing protein [Chthoniobacteraceae bacterium]